MELEVRPEPAPEERRAILAALEALEREQHAGGRSRWREAAWLEAATAAERLPERPPE